MTTGIDSPLRTAGPHTIHCAISKPEAREALTYRRLLAFLPSDVIQPATCNSLVLALWDALTALEVFVQRGRATTISAMYESSHYYICDGIYSSPQRTCQGAVGRACFCSWYSSTTQNPRLWKSTVMLTYESYTDSSLLDHTVNLMVMLDAHLPVSLSRLSELIGT